MKKSKNKQPKIRREWTRNPKQQVVPNGKKHTDDCPDCSGTGIVYGSFFYKGLGDHDDCLRCGGTGLI